MKPAKVALIGARGYTGQALINLLNAHGNMDLRHVSSRELAGQKLKGYEKREITYENLSADDVRRMEDKGEIDCWVMALPNGIPKPPAYRIDDCLTDPDETRCLQALHRSHRLRQEQNHRHRRSLRRLPLHS